MLRERTRATHHIPANLRRHDPVSDEGQPWRLDLPGIREWATRGDT
jgi:hypothetical protein